MDPTYDVQVKIDRFDLELGEEVFNERTLMFAFGQFGFQSFVGADQLSDLVLQHNDLLGQSKNELLRLLLRFEQNSETIAGHLRHFEVTFASDDIRQEGSDMIGRAATMVGTEKRKR
jgi:hypothetical protein